MYVCYNLWFGKFAPWKDEIYPRLRTTELDTSNPTLVWLRINISQANNR